jgi:hypothetical protein
MNVGILRNPSDLSAYLCEILKTWGLALSQFVQPDSLSALDPATMPVLVCPTADQGETIPPSGQTRPLSASIIDYARRGGTVVCFVPRGELARAAGLENQGAKDGPLCLRITTHPAAGLAGESLPVVGNAETYSCTPQARVLAYLSHPGRFEGESLGIVETRAGRGRIVAFAFDLPLCVLLLRQGDPQRTERIPRGDSCARPSHMAVELGSHDAAWTPFADLLARLLVDVVRERMPVPVPLLSHLPGTAPGVLLYSGDEDGAEIAWNDEELDYVAKAGGRMNLYLIPIRTESTDADVQRYLAHHDVGPHPDLRPWDGRPVDERLAEFERQILLFEDMFRVKARTLRNHSTAWAGYLEPIEIMEKLGVSMDANYFSGGYKRNRQSAPYAAFGAAMPMHFCRPDGHLLNVYQQHTHLSDDVVFGSADYSYKYAAAQYSVILDRILTDILTRFHTPYAVCIHPSNWVRFSRPHGQELLRQAAARGLPIWSFDQWSAFWRARDTWEFSQLDWDGASLQFTLAGSDDHDALCFTLPVKYAGASLGQVQVDQDITEWQRQTRYGKDLALVPVPAGRRTVCVSTTYGKNQALGAK